jgi:hypothetical protein
MSLLSLFRRGATSNPAIGAPAVERDVAHSALVQPARRPYVAKQALPWTAKITEHNRLIDQRVFAQKLELFARWYWMRSNDTEAPGLPKGLDALLKKRSEQHEGYHALLLALWDCAEAKWWQDSRNVVVTKDDQPLQPLLTPEEEAAAREAGNLHRQVAAVEGQRGAWIPTKEEILIAAQGNEARAQQIQDKIDTMIAEISGAVDAAQNASTPS